MIENQTIEWKESWRDEYLKWISGFANAQGGTLILGKKDSGEIIGLPNAKQLLEEIPNKVRDLLGIMVEVNLRKQKGKSLLEIVVAPYPSPISYKGQYFYRSGSTKQELKGAALDRFLLQKQGRHWDGVPIPYVKISELDSKAIENFRRLARKSGRLDDGLLGENDSQLLEKLHLVENRYLKRAATLLFHPDPEKFTTGAVIKIGFFRSDSDLLYHDLVQGDLFTQVDRTMDLLLTKYLRAGISYRGTQRFERFPVPEAALREALVNAVVHKDYSAATPIQISVYDDKLLLWNAGQLPPDWSLKKLLAKHESQPANPDIANTFFRAGKIESWGRGIELIRKACQGQQYPAPRFDFDSGGLWVEFSFPKVTSHSAEASVEMSVKASVEILRLLRENPLLTLAEVADRLKLSTRTVERASAKLTKEGAIRHIGSPKKGYWEVLKGTDALQHPLPATEAESEKKSVKMSVKASVKMSVEILRLLRENPSLTLAEVADRLELSTRTVERASAKLVKDGYLQYVGSQKSGYWEVLKGLED